MPTRLEITNKALREIGEAELVDVDDDTEPGRVTRSAWYTTVRGCLERGDWNFATTRTKLEKLAETPEFGWKYYYGKPTTWLRTIHMSDSDAARTSPQIEYSDEGGRIAADGETVYMLYVDAEWIDKVGSWPQTFADYVSAELKASIAKKLVSASANMMAELRREAFVARRNALSFDARQNPPTRWGRGRWVNARFSRRTAIVPR